EDAPCGLLLLDAQGRIRRANRTFLGWTGHDPEKLIGSALSDHLPIAGKIFYETRLAPMLHLQQRFDEIALDFVRPDGSRVPTLVNAVQGRGDSDGRSVSTRLAVFRTADRRQYE